MSRRQNPDMTSTCGPVWCDQCGIKDPMADDRVCYSDDVTIELSTEDHVEVQEGSFEANQLHIYLHQHATAGQPRMTIARGDLPDAQLSFPEARSLVATIHDLLVDAEKHTS